MTDRKQRSDREAVVELGDEVELNPKTARAYGAVMAVRLSPDLLARLNEYASARDMTISEAMRRGAEQLLAGVGHSRSLVYHTGAVLTGPGIVHGSPTSGTGQSLRRDAIDDGDPTSLTR